MDDALHDPLAWLQAQAEPDPVRRRVLEGLARRAAGQSGALRERLVERLVEHARTAPPSLTSLTSLTSPTVPAAPVPAEATRPLAALVAQLQATGTELRQVHAHERTWRALRLTRRLAEVSAPVPEHLGPLNSQVLVARALQALQTLSPGYLQRLLTQLDALAALAPLQAAESGPDKPARRPAAGTAAKAAPRKTAGARRR